MKKMTLSTAVCVASMLFAATAAQASDLGMPKHLPNVLQVKCDGSDCYASNYTAPAGVNLLLAGAHSGSYTMNSGYATPIAYCPGKGKECDMNYYYERTAKDGKSEELTVALVSYAARVMPYTAVAGSWTRSEPYEYTCNGITTLQCPYIVSH